MGEETLLHAEFIKTAKKFKEKPAFIDKTTGKDVTYEKALIASLIFAAKFKKYSPGFIGIMIPTSAGCALSILGALISGRVPVLINYSAPADKNAVYAQKKVGFKTIITSKALLEKIGCPRIDGMVFIEDIMSSISVANKLSALSKSKLPVKLLLNRIHLGDPKDASVILFTSGSEKEPKAVPLSHLNISSNIEGLSEAFNLVNTDRFLASLPFFHSFGLTSGLWMPLFFGMTIITYANPLDFKEICKIAREEKITLMVGTPSFFWGYLNKSKAGDFSTIRIALAGADKCPDALRQAFLEKHNITLFEAYGTTETSPAISVNTPAFNRPGSVGKVLKNVEVKLVNIDTGNQIATGESGKILVKGDLVMEGYYDDLEETSLRLRDGWYDTGDMGFFDEDNYLWHAGRLKRFVKIGGEMISLVKVENELEKLLPSDIGCCVVELPDLVKGANIIAVVTKKVESRKLIKALAKELPAIAVPKRFIVIEEMPYMGSGKIDFRAVTAMVKG